MPLWDHGVSFTIDDAQTVQTPLNIVPAYAYEKNSPDSVYHRIIANTVTFLVMQREKGRKDVTMRVVRFIAEDDYLMDNPSKIFRFSLSSLSDYCGKIFNYDIQGNLLDGVVYRNGEQTGIISPLSGNDAATRSYFSGGRYYERFSVSSMTGSRGLSYDPTCQLCSEFGYACQAHRINQIDEVVVVGGQRRFMCGYISPSYSGGGSGGGSSGGGGGGGSSSGGGGSSGETTSSPSIQLAKDMFRNSNLSLEGWELLARALDKIIADCMGNKLYDKLIDKLNGGTIIIELDPNSSDSEFSYTPGKSNAKITWGIKDNAGSHSLVHEMTHTLQAFETGSAPTSLNNEVEARRAEYLYLQRNVNTNGTLYTNKYKKGSIGGRLIYLDNYIDSKGNLINSNDNAAVENIAYYMGQAIKNGRAPNGEQPYANLNWNTNIKGINNFKNINPLLKNCL